MKDFTMFTHVFILTVQSRVPSKGFNDIFIFSLSLLFYTDDLIHYYLYLMRKQNKWLIIHRRSFELSCRRLYTRSSLSNKWKYHYCGLNVCHKKKDKFQGTKSSRGRLLLFVLCEIKLYKEKEKKHYSERMYLCLLPDINGTNQKFLFSFLSIKDQS